MQVGKAKFNNLDAIDTLVGAVRQHCGSCDKPERRDFSLVTLDDFSANPCNCERIDVLRVFAESLKEFHGAH